MNFGKAIYDHGGSGEFTPVSWNVIAQSIFDHERSKNLERFVDYQWKTFIESQELAKKISEKKVELTRVENAPKKKSERWAECEAAYVDHGKKRAEILSAIYRNKKSGGLAGVGPHSPNIEAFAVLSVYVTRDEHLAAKSTIEAEPGAIGESEKKETAMKLRREIAGLEEEKAKLDPPEFFKSTVDHQDCRKLFVQKWIETQRQVNKACNIIGVDLKLCSPNQRAAHSILGLGRYINKEGMSPCSYRA